MSESRPTESYDWADSAAAGDVQSPSSSLRANGYGYKDPIPYEEFNYLLHAPGQWLGWVEAGAGDPTLSGFLRNANVGDSAFVGDRDDSKSYIYQSDSANVDEPDVDSVVSTGNKLFALTADAGNNAVSLEVADTENLSNGFSYVDTIAGSFSTVIRLYSNGTKVWFALDTVVLQYDVATETRDWTRTLPANDTKGMATDGSALFVTYDASSGEDELAILDPADGSTIDTSPVNPGETIGSVAAGGDGLVATVFDDNGSDLSVRRDYWDGTQFVGLGTDALTAYDVDETTPIVALPSHLVLYAPGGGGSLSGALVVMDWEEGYVRAETDVEQIHNMVPLNGTEIVAIQDDAFNFTRMIRVFESVSGQMSYTKPNHNQPSPAGRFRDLHCDGHHIWTARDDSAPTDLVRRFTINDDHKRFTRTGSSVPHRPIAAVEAIPDRR